MLQSRLFRSITFLLAALLALSTACYADTMSGSGQDKPSSISQELRESICKVSKKYVREALATDKDFNSVTFESSADSFDIERIDDSTYSVYSKYVVERGDSKIRGTFILKLQDTGKSNWQLMDMQMTE